MALTHQACPDMNPITAVGEFDGNDRFRGDGHCCEFKVFTRYNPPASFGGFAKALSGRAVFALNHPCKLKLHDNHIYQRGNGWSAGLQNKMGRCAVERVPLYKEFPQSAMRIRYL
jgi:hypothetical protein